MSIAGKIEGLVAQLVERLGHIEKALRSIRSGPIFLGVSHGIRSQHGQTMYFPVQCLECNSRSKHL